MGKFNIIYHNLPGTALTRQNKIDQSNFPFTLNTSIGCFFGCQYCYTQGFPFCCHTNFGKEVKIKTWMPEVLDKELEKYRNIPQHLKRVQINSSTEGYLPLGMIKTKKDLNRDLIMETLQVFRNHWQANNRWMLHLVTKSHWILYHRDFLAGMRDQVQVEITLTTLDENRKKILEGKAPTVKKRLEVIDKLADSGIFVRVMCMPFIGTFHEAAALRDVVFGYGAQAFKHKGMNYFDENELLKGNTVRVSGRKDIIFKNLLVLSGEPPFADGMLPTKVVKMPKIVKPGKTKRWSGTSVDDFEDRTMAVENFGYSAINDVNWGYII